MFLNISLMLIVSYLLTMVNSGGICKYKANYDPATNSTITAEKQEYDHCDKFVSSDSNCRKKCTNFNFSPNYSCKIAQSPYNNCTLQCNCFYFSPSYAEQSTTLPPATSPPKQDQLPTPNNECLIYGIHCETLCTNGTQYCQVNMPWGTKSCVCHHWIRGNTLIGAFNDFLSINESLFSNNALFELRMVNYTTLSLINVTSKETMGDPLMGDEIKSIGRFTLRNDGIFTVQSSGIIFNDAILLKIDSIYPYLEGSSYLRVENCGQAFFYDINWERIANIGPRSYTRKPYSVCPDVDKPDTIY